MIEQVPVTNHFRRDAREQARHRMRTRLGGIGGVAAALGITALVVMAPMAQGANPAPVAVAPAQAPVVTTVGAGTAPVVTSTEALELPSFTLNPPPPAPVVKKKAKVKTPNVDAQAQEVAGEGDHGGCGDKSYDGNKDD